MLASKRGTRMERSSTGEEGHACDHCERVFPTAERLAVHAKVHRGGPERPLKCPDCRRTFRRTDKLREHQRVHQGGKPHHCNVCGKAFTHRQTLVEHLHRHKGVRTMQCDRCPQAFYFRCDLVRHLRCHTGERPFQCRSCPVRFAGRSELLSHERIHDGDRPHRCEECNCSFARNSSLVRHLLRHTGKLPFECHLCPNAFARPYLLQAHLKDHPQPLVISGIHAEKNRKKADQEQRRRQRQRAVAADCATASSKRQEDEARKASPPPKLCMPIAKPASKADPICPLMAIENAPSKSSSSAYEDEFDSPPLSLEGENRPCDDHLYRLQPEAALLDNRVLAVSCGPSEVKSEALLGIAFPPCQSTAADGVAEPSAELSLMQSLSMCHVVPEGLGQHEKQLSTVLGLVSTLAKCD